MRPGFQELVPAPFEPFPERIRADADHLRRFDQFEVPSHNTNLLTGEMLEDGGHHLLGQQKVLWVGRVDEDFW